MCSPGINGEGELRGSQLTQVHLEKWLLKQTVYVCVCVCAIKYTDGTSVVDTGVIFVYCAWHSSALIYLHTI